MKLPWISRRRFLAEKKFLEEQIESLREKNDTLVESVENLLIKNNELWEEHEHYIKLDSHLREN